MLPDERRKVYGEKGLLEANANKLIQNRSLSDFFNTLLEENIDFKIASNILLGDVSAYLNKEEKSITDTTLTKERFIELVKTYSDGTISSKNLKEMLDSIMESDKSIKDIMQEQGIENISDDAELKQIIHNIILLNIFNKVLKKVKKV